MLIDFQFRNYASFWRPTDFSMVASDYPRHPDHVVNVKGNPGCSVLRSAFIFGANAGGKSNFVEAIAFAKRIVEQGLDGISCDRRAFRLAPPGEKDDVGVFQFTIAAGTDLYEYGLAISYSKAAIAAEWLTLITDRKHPQQIFVCNMTGKKPSVRTDFKLKGMDKMSFTVYSNDVCRRKSSSEQDIPAASFLGDVVRKRGMQSNSAFFAHLSTVYSWFQNLYVIFPSTTFAGKYRVITRKDKLVRFGKMLKHFDTGIEGLKAQAVKVDKVLADLRSSARENAKAQLIATLKPLGKEACVTLQMQDNTYLARYSKAKGLILQKLVANHGNKDDLFALEDESDGTQRLYDLLMLYHVFNKGGVVVVDELDRSLHTKATVEFIRMFFNESQDARSQFIATTHDISALSLSLLRRDEIWFVERGEDHASSLYPLTMFKERVDTKGHALDAFDLSKDYLIGRYGALPFFRNLH